MVYPQGQRIIFGFTRKMHQPIYPSRLINGLQQHGGGSFGMCVEVTKGE
jgi:hypothetical protein